jgi:OFA family oxalate/formate antiporter-like MFS transporter
LAAASTHAPRPGAWLHPALPNRWVRLVAGVVAMMALAGVVLVWPILRGAPGRSFAETLVAAENAFAAFIYLETIFVPLEAWLGNRASRWLLVAAGGALVALGALEGAGATTVRAQVGWYALGGAGAGLVYGGTVAKVLKGFTDRKALCVGVTAIACAGVIGLAVTALAALSSGRAMPVLVVLGAAQAAVILVATLFIVAPPPQRPPPDW